ncbi:MAG TPA: hypothetical protein VH331_01595 [Allosphingosinicella sp.]|nr:hypothetical protein [Allosphingosinicella sp.]
MTWGDTYVRADRTGTQGVLVEFAWAPYVDNGGNADKPTCPTGGMASPPVVRLTEIAFPASFSSFDFPARELFACVLTRADGRILEVKLAQPIHGGAADRELIAAIEHKWRFEAAENFEPIKREGAGWQRVRINRGLAVERPYSAIL